MSATTVYEEAPPAWRWKRRPSTDTVRIKSEQGQNPSGWANDWPMISVNRMRTFMRELHRSVRKTLMAGGPGRRAPSKQIQPFSLSNRY
jgi:hypothetical protein